jgi:hypothetical protein
VWQSVIARINAAEMKSIFASKTHYAYTSQLHGTNAGEKLIFMLASIQIEHRRNSNFKEP